MERRKVFQISVPDWMRREEPLKAAVCDLINADLAGCPQRTLEEFARLLNRQNVASSYERLQEAVRNQITEPEEEVFRLDGEPYYYQREESIPEEVKPF